jgi:hypothetical protein
MVICVVLGDGWWKTPVVELLQSHTDSRHADAERVAKMPNFPAIKGRKFQSCAESCSPLKHKYGRRLEAG